MNRRVRILVHVRGCFCVSLCIRRRRACVCAQAGMHCFITSCGFVIICFNVCNYLKTAVL